MHMSWNADTTLYMLTCVCRPDNTFNKVVCDIKALMYSSFGMLRWSKSVIIALMQTPTEIIFTKNVPNCIYFMFEYSLKWKLALYIIMDRWTLYIICHICIFCVSFSISWPFILITYYLSFYIFYIQYHSL